MNDKTVDNVDEDSSRFYDTCSGYQGKRTACTKRCGPVSLIWYIVIAVVVVCAFIYFFSLFNNIFVSFFYTILFVFAFNLNCLFLVHEVFKRIKKFCKKKYYKNVAKLKNINYRNNKKED